MLLTNKISATIAQLRFNATDPKNTSAYAAGAFTGTTSIAPNRKGALISRPKAHIIGSARGYRFFSDCANTVPSGTPTIPDTIVIAPNTNATLQKKTFKFIN